jgi:hypothetical protein
LANGSTAIDGLSGSGSSGGVGVNWCVGGTDIANAVDAHWPGNVLDLLLTQIFECDLDLVAHLIAHYPADTDPAGLPESFQTGRDIHSVAEDVLAFDNYIAEVDADAKLDPLLPPGGFVTPGHPPLKLDPAPHGVDDAGKFREQAVAGVLHDPPAVLGDLRMDQFLEVPSEPPVGSLLISAHQARVAGHVGGEDRGEAADRGHFSPRSKWLNQAYLETGLGPSIQWFGPPPSAGVRRRVAVSSGSNSAGGCIGHLPEPAQPVIRSPRRRAPGSIAGSSSRAL